VGAAVALGVDPLGGVAQRRHLHRRRRPAVVAVGVPEHDAVEATERRRGR
jgi:hypothetical protein